MEYYYKNVVLTDMENFWTENAPEEYPVRQYAEAKGFDQDLFAEFYHKVCNNEPLYTGHPAMGNGDKSATFFYLTDEEQTTFANFINYYNTVSEGKFWAYSDDTAGAIVNSYDEIEKYWRTPRTVPEDEYHEQRTYTAPFMYDQNKHVNIPLRYKPEWYYPVDDSLVAKWNLSPTSGETPFEDIPIADFASQTLQGELGNRSTYREYRVQGAGGGGHTEPSSLMLPEGTTWTVNGDTIKFSNGDTIKAIPDEGYTFVGWDEAYLDPVICKDTTALADFYILDNIQFNVEYHDPYDRDPLPTLPGIIPSSLQVLTDSNVSIDPDIALKIGTAECFIESICSDYEIFPSEKSFKFSTYKIFGGKITDGTNEKDIPDWGAVSLEEFSENINITAHVGLLPFTFHHDLEYGTLHITEDESNNRPLLEYIIDADSDGDKFWIIINKESYGGGDYNISNMTVSQNLQSYVSISHGDEWGELYVGCDVPESSITGTLEFDINTSISGQNYLIKHVVYTFTLRKETVNS